MCGIVGRLQLAGGVERSALQSAAECLRHRGPDGHGVWVSPDTRVGVAHRRLSIIDLSADAAQPMRRDESLTLTFNGEIYNFAELRETLASMGHHFRTRSDSEVLLAAYAAWGPDCVSRLEGMFAFCIVDTTRQVLFLARDRAGEKPLYYHATASGFTFASELKALMHLEPTLRSADSRALASYLAFGYVPGDQCLLAGVKKLPPAYSAEVRLADAAVRVQRYWTPPAEDVTCTWSAEEAAAHLEPVLQGAIQRQMISDVPIGVMLSGGVDSSLIAALAARGAKQPIRTYSIAFGEDPRFNESAHARFVAGAIGSVHTELPVSVADAGVLDALVGQYDEPFADSSMIPTFILCRAMRQEVTVALGGDGADELFGGYPQYSWVQSTERLKSRIPKPARHVLAAAGALLPTGIKGKSYLANMGRDLRDSYARTQTYFGAADRRRLTASGVSHTGDPDAPERWRANLGAGGLSSAGTMRLIDFQSYLPDDILVKVDRASMLASLEVRAPFLDARVCDFAFRLPGRLLATESARKIVLRALAARTLPPEFDAIRKQGFSIPLSTWMRGQWSQTVEEALMSTPEWLLDRKAAMDILNGTRRGLANSHRVFALVMLSRWCSRYGITNVTTTDSPSPLSQ